MPKTVNVGANGISSARLGEIGHELNNLLMGIQGSAGEIEHAVPARASQESVARIVQAAERSSALADELIRASLMPSATPRAAPAGTGRPVALVVEDEPIVGALAGQMLVRCGYDVLAADTGEDALEMLEDAGQPLALVLTDIVMPGMNGVAVAQAAKRLRPDVAVILMSGYTEERFADQIDAGATFLHKPFTLANLEVAIAGVRPVAPAPAAHRVSLTPREVGVLTLLAEGRTNDQAAARLGIAPDTVQSHVHHAMRKLGAESRTQAVAAAIRLALIG